MDLEPVPRRRRCRPEPPDGLSIAPAEPPPKVVEEISSLAAQKSDRVVNSFLPRQRRFSFQKSNDRNANL